MLSTPQAWGLKRHAPISVFHVEPSSPHAWGLKLYPCGSDVVGVIFPTRVGSESLLLWGVPP